MAASVGPFRVCSGGFREATAFENEGAAHVLPWIASRGVGVGRFRAIRWCKRRLRELFRFADQHELPPAVRDLDFIRPSADVVLRLGRRSCHGFRAGRVDQNFAPRRWYS